MADSSLITLTEVSRDYRRATMHEKGWAFQNATYGTGTADDCAILWRTDTWHRKMGNARKLSTIRFTGHLTGATPRSVWAANALLKRVNTGHTLLVGVTHMPAHLEGIWRHPGTEEWRARKKAYTDAIKRWTELIQAQQRKYKPSATLITADWNLDLRDEWVREYLGDNFRKAGLRRAWTHFPTTGGSLGGNRIIDGSYYKGMEITREPELGARVRSSDHRPFRESFKITGKPGAAVAYDPATGHVKKGTAWWGFGDYAYDEMFEKVTETDEGTVVTFDFDEPPY